VGQARAASSIRRWWDVVQGALESTRQHEPSRAGTSLQYSESARFEAVRVRLPHHPSRLELSEPPNSLTFFRVVLATSSAHPAGDPRNANAMAAFTRCVCAVQVLHAGRTRPSQRHVRRAGWDRTFMAGGQGSPDRTDECRHVKKSRTYGSLVSPSERCHAPRFLINLHT
jgi:hypothetical protein